MPPLPDPDARLILATDKIGLHRADRPVLPELDREIKARGRRREHFYNEDRRLACKAFKAGAGAIHYDVRVADADPGPDAELGRACMKPRAVQLLQQLSQDVRR